MKVCSKCKQVKTIEEFHKRKNRLCESCCKVCKAELDRIRYSKNRAKNLARMKIWREANRERMRSYNKSEKAKTQKVQYRSTDDYKNSAKAYYQRNKEYILNSQKVRDKKRQKVDLNYQLTKILRSRLGKALTKGYKKGSAVRDLGCTISEFKTYLESKFQPGMTWENYGYRGWHVDHIKPLASFDLTDREQFKEACHYTNLQPLWASDNLRKGARSMVK